MTYPLMKTTPGFAGLIGVARRDITPPIGIYARSWGAASHDVAEGIHRPLSLTAATFQAQRGDTPLALVSVDAGWYRDYDSEQFVRQHVLEACQLPESHLAIALTHTHAACSISLNEADKPGGHLIEPYVRHLRAMIVEAIREAMDTAEPATLTVGQGACTLATNRDLPEPVASDQPRIVCGYNPSASADTTLLVGRITRDAGETPLATIVNYACHPTTLAWQNKLISPDYIGAMREVVEAQTAGVPCLFLQGASGELAAAHQYTGNTAVADAHGRTLGYAALATLAAMPAPNTALAYIGVKESGAPLAVWQPTACDASGDLVADQLAVTVPLKPDLPSLESLQAELEKCSDRTLCERLHRKRNVVRTVGSGSTTTRPVWHWKLGSVLFIGQPDETYSYYQQTLRAAYPDHAIFVANVVNGSCGYLAPETAYDHNIYQVWQSPFGRGALEAFTAQVREHMQHTVAATTV